MSKTKIFSFLLILGLGAAPPAPAQQKVRILSLHGDVQVRRGMDEDWLPARSGMLLRELDTILTGEAAEVVLQITEDSTFRLGENCILDISDLRKITERELFLYLMSQKVKEIDAPVHPAPLRQESVSVVRGEKKHLTEAASMSGALRRQWRLEVNGARALYGQGLYPNAILKNYRILERYYTIPDCGEVHFYLGEAFEKLDERGRALEAYRAAEQRLQAGDCGAPAFDRRAEDIAKAIRRLKK